LSIFSLGIQLGQGKASAAVRCAGRQSGRSTTTATTNWVEMRSGNRCAGQEGCHAGGFLPLMVSSHSFEIGLIWKLAGQNPENGYEENASFAGGIGRRRNFIAGTTHHYAGAD
jgi:hypothetical protein